MIFQHVDFAFHSYQIKVRVMSTVPALGKQGRRIKFKASLSYLTSLRPNWILVTSHTILCHVIPIITTNLKFGCVLPKERGEKEIRNRIILLSVPSPPHFFSLKEDSESHACEEETPA